MHGESARFERPVRGPRAIAGRPGDRVSCRAAARARRPGLREGAAVVNASAVNHIGIAVRSVDAQRGFYEDVLGARFEGVEEVPDQHVRVAFYALGPADHAVRLELLEPTSAESPIAAFIEKRGEGLHHIAYTVRDLSARLAELKAQGVRLIDERARMGAHGAHVAFVHPKASMGVLTELCEHAAHRAG
ncbi:MAG: methylmalonyl-CoA epimerase [Phycisphaerales bacterium]|nr:methylmalonyl-CoA epimerase [Phycisphaerales bacterium]